MLSQVLPNPHDKGGKGLASACTPISQGLEADRRQVPAQMLITPIHGARIFSNAIASDSLQRCGATFPLAIRTPSQPSPDYSASTIAIELTYVGLIMTIPARVSRLLIHVYLAIGVTF
jgi:hypothetical protein